MQGDFFIALIDEIHKLLRYDTNIYVKIKFQRKLESLLSKMFVCLNLWYGIVEWFLWTVMLYGCESWTLSLTIIKTIEAAETWFYRKPFEVRGKIK